MQYLYLLGFSFIVKLTLLKPPVVIRPTGLIAPQCHPNEKSGRARRLRRRELRASRNPRNGAPLNRQSVKSKMSNVPFKIISCHLK